MFFSVYCFVFLPEVLQVLFSFRCLSFVLDHMSQRCAYACQVNVNTGKCHEFRQKQVIAFAVS